jgi:hypothetical protein
MTSGIFGRLKPVPTGNQPVSPAEITGFEPENGDKNRQTPLEPTAFAKN